MSDRVIETKLTRAGLAAVFSASNTGVGFELTHIALGTGQGAGYVPTGNETGLRTEFQRVAISGGDYIGDFEIAVQTLFEGVPAGWVHEIGIFGRRSGSNDPPILFALWSEINQPLLYKTTNVPVIVAATLALDEVPEGAVTWVAGGPSVNIMIAGPFAQISASLISLIRWQVQAEVSRLTPIIQNTWR